MYCLNPMEKFAEMPQEEVKRIASEITLKGRTGLDSNDPAQKYQLKRLPGDFSGVNLVCLMDVAFKSFAPEMDIGFDLSKEYAAADTLCREEKLHWRTHRVTSHTRFDGERHSAGRTLQR